MAVAAGGGLCHLPDLGRGGLHPAGRGGPAAAPAAAARHPVRGGRGQPPAADGAGRERGQPAVHDGVRVAAGPHLGGPRPVPAGGERRPRRTAGRPGTRLPRRAAARHAASRGRRGAAAGRRGRGAGRRGGRTGTGAAAARGGGVLPADGAGRGTLGARPSGAGAGPVGGALAFPALQTAVLVMVGKSLALDVPAGHMAVAYLAATVAVALVPTPGGIGSVEAALVVALVAAGGPAGVATAVVLAFRLLTVWLPLLPGALTLAALVRLRVI
ncbi:UPF0104 family protein [Streptomyces sp. SHP22-7]|nr:UPF0104 family protein [Streptomyces sp. SHP22-7]